MSKPVRYPAGLKIPVGGNPEVDQTFKGAKVFRRWQSTAFKYLYKKLLRIVVAPTASGKSLLIIALVLKDLQDGRAQKGIVSVPQSIIASGFDGGLKLKLPGGQIVTWTPGHRLIETTNIVERIRSFLVTPLAVNKLNPERILICSHAALVAYHSKYHGPTATNPNDWSDYREVAISIDEAHHSRAPGEESEEDARDAEACNRLGQFVSDWLDRKPGPLTLTSATWFRTDRIAIVPPTRYDEFARYTHTMIDFLRSHQHLKEIEIRFLSGEPEDCVAQIQCEDPRANTLVYLRPVGPGRDKFDDLTKLVQRLQLSKSKIVDLVEPIGRDRRKDELLKSIKAGEWDLKLNGTRKKNWLFALMLGREGFDLPALQRSIVIGPRAALQVTLQMLGRLLRDHPGKTKVQFNIVLPFLDDDMQNGALIQSYTKVMLAALALGAILNPPKFDRPEDQATFEKSTNDGPDVLADNLVAVADELGDDPVSDSDALVDGLIKNGKINLTEGCTVESMRRVLLAILKRQTQVELLAGLPDPTMAVDDFAGIRAWRLSFGHKTLTNLRRMIGKYVPFTWESADAAIRAWFDGGEL